MATGAPEGNSCRHPSLVRDAHTAGATAAQIQIECRSNSWHTHIITYRALSLNGTHLTRNYSWEFKMRAPKITKTSSVRTHARTKSECHMTVLYLCSIYQWSCELSCSRLVWEQMSLKAKQRHVAAENHTPDLHTPDHRLFQ